MRRYLDRRQLLIGGATMATLGAAGAAADEAIPDDGAAYAPWRQWRNDPAEGPAGLLRSAVLAANAHDTQPWLYCVAGDRIDLYADESRNLGAMDPFRREMQLSLGCAVENLVLAARAQGYDPKVAPAAGTLAATMPGPRLAVRIDLRRAAPAPSPLAAAIPRRHTTRNAYDRDRPVDGETLERLRSAAVAGDGVRLVFLTDKATQAEFAAATVAATEAIIADPEMIADSDAWFRATDAEIDAHRDGPTLAAAGLSSMKLMFARLLPISREQSHRGWLDNTRDTQLATAASFGVIAVKDLYDREQALAAGRLWQRLHLAGTVLGLALQPLNQLPERVDRDRQLGRPGDMARTLAALTGAADWHATFAFRLGWPDRLAPASPRRDLASVTLPAACAGAKP